VLSGAHIVRVHSVAAMVQVVRVADAIRAAAGSP
jgi:dihydropteroate synthase